MDATERHEHDFQFHADVVNAQRCAAPGCGVLTDFAPNHHPYRLLRAPGGNLVAVDEGVTRLVVDCWAAGIETFTSCQGGCGGANGASLAYLTFSTADRDTVAGLLGDRPGLTWEEQDSRGRQTVRWEAAEPCGQRATEDAHGILWTALSTATADITITGADGTSVSATGPAVVAYKGSAWNALADEFRKALGIPNWF